MMFTTRDMKGHTQMCLTFIFKVNHQGQVTDSAFAENPRPCKCWNRHQDQVSSLYTARDKKGHTINMCDLEFQSQPSRSHSFFHIFDIPDLENVRIDTKINFVSCLQPEMRTVMRKGV